jgi:hypothetical protein
MLEYVCQRLFHRVTVRRAYENDTLDIFGYVPVLLRIILGKDECLKDKLVWE